MCMLTGLVSKFNTAGLKSLLKQALSEPEFYGDLVYKFEKSVGRTDFSDQFRKNIIRYKRIGYNMNVTRRTACLVCLWSGPPGFSCRTSVALAFQSWFVGEYLSCVISVMNLDLYVRCFDSSISRSPSCGPNNFYVYMSHIRT